MEYVPLIFFSALFLYSIKTRGFDVGAYITLLYVITSLFSFLMFKLGLIENAFSKPSLFATTAYCVLLLISLIPIYKLKINDVDLQITDKSEKAIKTLAIIFFINLLLFLYLNIEEIVEIIRSGEYLFLRQEIQTEEVSRASGLKGYLGILTNILSSISFVMILVFFISITYLKKSWKFNLIVFLGSLTQVLSGILTINRSNGFYYVVIFGLCAVLFWKKVPTRIKVRFIIPIATVFLGIYTFFTAVTISRFDSNNAYGGVNNSLISYAGMPYSNFCYFFDNYKNPDWASTRFLFPVSNFAINGYRAGVEREQEQTVRTGFNCVVFMTFLGSFIMDGCQLTSIVFLLIYLLLFRLCRAHIYHGTTTFVWLLAVFLLLVIPTVGCISYFYTNPFKSFALYLLLFWASKIK